MHIEHIEDPLTTPKPDNAPDIPEELKDLVAELFYRDIIKTTNVARVMRIVNRADFCQMLPFEDM
jgi:hypothetical protein